MVIIDKISQLPEIKYISSDLEIKDTLVYTFKTITHSYESNIILGIFRKSLTS